MICGGGLGGMAKNVSPVAARTARHGMDGTTADILYVYVIYHKK